MTKPNILIGRSSVMLLLAICLQTPLNAEQPFVAGSYADLLSSIEPYQKAATACYNIGSLKSAAVSGYILKKSKTDNASGFSAGVYESSFQPKEVVVAFTGTQADKWDFIQAGTWTIARVDSLKAAYQTARQYHRQGYLDVATWQRLQAVIRSVPGNLVGELANVNVDLRADIELAIRGTKPVQFTIAKEFCRGVIDSYPRGTTIRFTGHSLGGALALYVGAILGRDAIVFNAPGLNSVVFGDIPDTNRVSRLGGPYLLNLFSICGPDPFSTDMISHPPAFIESALEYLSTEADDLSLKNTIYIGTPIPVPVLQKKDAVCHGIAHYEPANLNLNDPITTRLNVAFSGKKTKFSDVPAAKGLDFYVADGVRMGLFVGRSETVFGFNDNLSRLEAAFLLRSISRNVNTALGPAAQSFLPNAPNQSLGFTDIGGLSQDARDAIGLLVANNVTSASNPEFRPNDAIKLGEFATWLTIAFSLDQNLGMGAVAGMYRRTGYSPLDIAHAVGTNAALRQNLENLQRLQVWRRNSYDPSAPAYPQEVLPWKTITSGVLDADASLRRRDMAVIVTNLCRFLIQNRL